jgi:hypothetical protein
MPIVGLPAVGELSYNGIVFGGASRISVVGINERDEAQQTTIYKRYIITVATVFQSNSGTDIDLMTVRSLLAEDGKPLIFRQKGFGHDLVITPAGPLRDIRMGPKPRVLEWHPIGASRACEVIWTVDTCVAECESPRKRQVGPIAFNYEIDFDINEHGDTTRTTSGYVEVAQTRLPGRRLSDTADRWRESLASKVPNGFKRTQRFRLSTDKSRLDFVITDTQIPSNNPYPKNVTDIQGRHGITASRSMGGFLTHRNVITVDINMKRGISGTQAWLIFLKIAQARILNAMRSSASTLVFIDEVSVEEELFGRGCSFMLGYRTIGQTLTDIITRNGLWQPLPSEWRWSEWHASIEKEQSLRGTRAMFHNPATDLIIDPCGDIPVGTIQIEQEPSRPRERVQPTFRNTKPPQENSYLTYDTYTAPYRDRPVCRQATLQPPENPSGVGTMDIPLQGGPVQPLADGFNYGLGGSVRDVLQERGAARFGIWLVGHAVRVGYQIPRPKALSPSGYQLVEKSSQFVQKPLGDFFGVQVYAAAWKILYYSNTTPGLVAPPLIPTGLA